MLTKNKYKNHQRKMEKGIKMDFNASISWKNTRRIILLSTLTMLTMLTTLLTACGSGSNKSSTPSADNTPPDAPTQPSFQRLTGGKVTVNGTAEAGSTVKITFADNTTVSAIVDSEGNYSATSPNPIVSESSSIITLEATDSSNNTSAETSATLPAPAAKSALLIGEFNPNVALIGIPYTSSLYANSGTTQSNGRFNYKEGETVTFTIADTQYNLVPQAVNAQSKLLPADAGIDAQQNLKLILKALDNNADASDGINLTGVNATVDAAESSRDVIKQLYKATGKMPDLLFKPSVAINTEAPQGDDTVGQPMPFVDVFKTARPFAELSATETKFDANGWPTTLDPNSDVNRPFARTKLLQGTQAGSIPNGEYTLLYEGSGKLEIGGKSISNITGLGGAEKGFNFNFILEDSEDPEANVLNIIVREIAPGEGNYIKNIRIIMPGGSCKDINGMGTAFVRVSSQFECPVDTDYVSYVDQIKNKAADDVTAVIFNPDYLGFLREFKVIRMMNLMEASHGSVSCPAINGARDEACITEPMLWENRAKLTDAVWGGNARTHHSKRNGVPIEIITSLANTLQRDMWVNMPHAADDNYIENMAEYVAQNLDENLKVYVEYANEAWNPGFLSHHFVEIKGIEAGYDVVPNEFIGFRVKEYFARLRFYSEHSLSIFNIWKDKFGGGMGANSGNNVDRIIRVLGTNQGDKILTEQMILNIGAQNLDAIAMAPYFFGCATNSGSCADAPKVFKDAISVDDVFDIIDQDKEVDPSALDSTINKMKVQAETASSFNKNLLSYEGGQHLTTSILGALNLDEAGKQRYLALFKKANRDPRMKERYETLLNSWKGLAPQGATLFTMYTLPQSYYRFGNWGLKEHLNKTRADSPKYDGVMSFQEAVGACWWEGCE